MSVILFLLLLLSCASATGWINMKKNIKNNCPPFISKDLRISIRSWPAHAHLRHANNVLLHLHVLSSGPGAGCCPATLHDLAGASADVSRSCHVDPSRASRRHHWCLNVLNIWVLPTVRFYICSGWWDTQSFFSRLGKGWKRSQRLNHIDSICSESRRFSHCRTYVSHVCWDDSNLTALGISDGAASRLLPEVQDWTLVQVFECE